MPGSNVRLEGKAVASPVSPLCTSRTTFEAGCAVNTTVNVSVVPDSATCVLPPVSVTVKPATSLSCAVAVTVALSQSSALHRNVALPFRTSSSSSAVMVTVLAVSQSPEVKVRVAALDARARPSSPLCHVTVTVTLASGSPPSSTANVACPPSATNTASGSATTRRSLSPSCAVTSLLSQPSALHRIVAVPSIASGSSAAWSGTGWYTSQLSLVKTRLDPDCTETLSSPPTCATVTVTSLAGRPWSRTPNSPSFPSGTPTEAALVTITRSSSCSVTVMAALCQPAAAH